MSISSQNPEDRFSCDVAHLYMYWDSVWSGGARWLSGSVSDSGARGRGSKSTAAVLCP